mmetsp:Transcript_8489/g.20451  ORF Transcript_8489/g.20451 Transcript_8489/m.20451 type:complete len:677 (+) Transcript_8489:1241-3271(+)
MQPDTKPLLVRRVASGRLSALGGVQLPPRHEEEGSGSDVEDAMEGLQVGVKVQWDAGKAQRIILAVGQHVGAALRRDESRISFCGVEIDDDHTDEDALDNDEGAETEGAKTERSEPQSPAQSSPARSPASERMRGFGRLLRSLGHLSLAAGTRRSSGDMLQPIRLSPPSHSKRRRASASSFSARQNQPQPLSRVQPLADSKYSRDAPFRSDLRSSTESASHEFDEPLSAPIRGPARPMRRPAVFPTPVLTARVVRARKLNNIYVGGLVKQQVNPYVTLRVGDVKRRTPPVPNCTSPVWEGCADCEFRFELPAGCAATTELEVAIKDRNAFGRNEWLARHRIPLSLVPPSTGANGTFLRMTLALPARRVRGSEAVDVAYGTELTLELKLDDMEGWWACEESGLNTESPSLRLGPPSPPSDSAMLNLKFRHLPSARDGDFEISAAQEAEKRERGENREERGSGDASTHGTAHYGRPLPRNVPSSEQADGAKELSTEFQSVSPSPHLSSRLLGSKSKNQNKEYEGDGSSLGGTRSPFPGGQSERSVRADSQGRQGGRELSNSSFRRGGPLADPTHYNDGRRLETPDSDNVGKKNSLASATRGLFRTHSRRERIPSHSPSTSPTARLDGKAASTPTALSLVAASESGVQQQQRVHPGDTLALNGLTTPAVAGVPTLVSHD